MFSPQMKRMNALGNKIFGDSGQISSERYFITMISFAVFVYLVISSIVNVIAGLPPFPYILKLILAAILLFFYFLVRFNGNLFYPKLFITLFGLAALNIAWYTKYLSTGPALFFFFAFGALLIWFWQKKSLAIILSLYTLNLIVLFYIEYTHPDLILEYASHQARTLDIYINFFLVFILMFYILYMLKKDFKREQEHAAKADKIKTAFLANISHEIRTPMNAIYGFSKLLETEQDENERLHYLKIIQRSSESLLKMINEIVDLSKIEAGYFNMQLTNFKVKELFDDLKRIYTKFMFDKGNEDIELSFTLSKKDLVLFSDHNRIRQVLINLIDNALKFTTHGTIKVQCRSSRTEAIFSVADTGTGIPKEDQKNIFGQFIKFNYEGLNKEGSGIGLSLVEKIIRMLNGRIWFHSTWGEGTTFHFALPVSNPEEGTEATTGTGKEVEQKKKIRQKVIVVAEDDITSFILLRKLLEPIGYKIHHARDGEETIDLVNSLPNIDLILMDLRMPHMNGYIATREIKKTHPGIPVIAQTAYALPGDKKKAIEAGCDDYISKPLNNKILLDLVNKYLTDD